jgi:heme-degrading monooxygenase HmoA
MKHVRVATYEIKTGTFQEIADKAQDGMLRTFRDQPGFIRYGLADLGDKTCLSLSLWDTR